MKLAIDETERRRAIQQAYNEAHGITPETVRKKISAGIELEAAKRQKNIAAAKDESETVYITVEYVDTLEREMLAAAEALEFERAALLRDQISLLRSGKDGAPKKKGRSRGYGRRGRR